MDFADSLKKAGNSAENAAQRGFESVKQGFEDMERRLRQRMRIYPERTKKNAAMPNESRAMRDNTSLEIGLPVSPIFDEPASAVREETRRKPIVSIHGEDVDEGGLRDQAA